MKRYIPHGLFTLVLAGTVLAGILIPTKQVYSATDPKATPTPNWCCDLIYSKYCPLCPAK